MDSVGTLKNKPVRQRPSRGRTHPSGEKRRREKVDRVAEILHAARQTLINDGYAEFSLRKIASRIGIRLASLQYHFRTKEELLRALLAETSARYEERLVPILANPQLTPRSRFLKAIDWLVAYNRQEDNARFFSQLWALATHDAYAAAIVDEMYTGYRHVLAELIQALNPSLKPEVREQRAGLLAGMIDGASFFVGPWIPQHAELRDIEKELKKFALKLATDL